MNKLVVIEIPQVMHLYRNVKPQLRQHFPPPLELGEVVQAHPNQDCDQRFVKILHTNKKGYGKSISVWDRSYFVALSSLKKEIIILTQQIKTTVKSELKIERDLSIDQIKLLLDKLSSKGTEMSKFLRPLYVQLNRLDLLHKVKENHL